MNEESRANMLNFPCFIIVQFLIILYKQNTSEIHAKYTSIKPLKMAQNCNVMSLSLSKLTLEYAWNCAKIDNFSGMIDKWSLGHVFLLFAVGCTQLIVLRKLFDAKPTSHKLTARAWQFGQYKNEINDFWKEKKTATANQRLSVGCIFGREPSICSAIVEIEPLLLVTNTFCISCQPTTKAAFTSNFKLNLLNKQVSEIKFSKKAVFSYDQS